MNRFFLMASLLASAAQAQTAEPCGSPIEVVNGVVKTKMVLTGAAKEDACVKAIATQLAADPELRGVTVELRTPDDQRVGGKALKAAQHVADVLAANGIAKEKVSAVVPRADGDEQGLKLVVRSAPPPLPTVQIIQLNGQALSGRDENKLEARKPGAGLSIRDVFVAKAGGATLSFPDSGNVQLFADSMVKVMPPSEKGVATIALVRGRLFVETLPSGNGLDVVVDANARFSISPASRAELSLSGDKWAASIYDGKVEIAGVVVDSGHGLSGQGATAQTPKPLLQAAKVTSTFGKPLEGDLKWDAVTGASRYRVDVAHDAGFGASTVSQTSSTQTLSVDPTIGNGRFFFRVVALDDADVAGAPSKVYSFTR